MYANGSISLRYCTLQVRAAMTHSTSTCATTTATLHTSTADTTGRHRLTETQARPDRQRATTSHLWRRPTKKHYSESEDTALRGMTAFLAFLQTLLLPHSTNHAPSTHNVSPTFLALSSSSQGTPGGYITVIFIRNQIPTKEVKQHVEVAVFTRQGEIHNLKPFREYKTWGVICF